MSRWLDALGLTEISETTGEQLESDRRAILELVDPERPGVIAEKSSIEPGRRAPIRGAPLASSGVSSPYFRPGELPGGLDSARMATMLMGIPGAWYELPRISTQTQGLEPGKATSRRE